MVCDPIINHEGVFPILNNSAASTCSTCTYKFYFSLSSSGLYSGGLYSGGIYSGGLYSGGLSGLIYRNAPFKKEAACVCEKHDTGFHTPKKSNTC